MSLLTDGLGGHPGSLITGGLAYTSVTITVTTHGISGGEPLTHQVSITIPVKATLLANVTSSVYLYGTILSEVMKYVNMCAGTIHPVKTTAIIKGFNPMGIYYILEILDDDEDE